MVYLHRITTGLGQLGLTPVYVPILAILCGGVNIEYFVYSSRQTGVLKLGYREAVGLIQLLGFDEKQANSSGPHD